MIHGQQNPESWVILNIPSWGIMCDNYSNLFIFSKFTTYVRDLKLIFFHKLSWPAKASICIFTAFKQSLKTCLTFDINHVQPKSN